MPPLQANIYFLVSFLPVLSTFQISIKTLNFIGGKVAQPVECLTHTEWGLRSYVQKLDVVAHTVSICWGGRDREIPGVAIYLASFVPVSKGGKKKEKKKDSSQIVPEE